MEKYDIPLVCSKCGQDYLIPKSWVTTVESITLELIKCKKCGNMMVKLG